MTINISNIGNKNCHFEIVTDKHYKKLHIPLVLWSKRPELNGQFVTT